MNPHEFDDGAYIPVTTRKQISMVRARDILYIEKDKRTIVIHAVDADYQFYGRLEEVYQRLGKEFYKCHSRCILNLSMVESMQDGLFYLWGGRTLKIGQNYYQYAKKKYKEFLMERLEKA